MVLLASVAFGLSFASYGALLVPFLMLLFVFGIALGVMACALVLRWGPAAEWFIWPIPALISPFVGVFYPLSTLPKWMQAIGHLIPPSYIFEGMRTILAKRAPPVTMLWCWPRCWTDCFCCWAFGCSREPIVTRCARA